MFRTDQVLINVVGYILQKHSLSGIRILVVIALKLYHDRCFFALRQYTQMVFTRNKSIHKQLANRKGSGESANPPISPKPSHFAHPRNVIDI